ncbi:MAG TPA: two-component regulator propeller domain-containing protein [Rhodanobacteraceae bacterium]|nr:two-component regulator propeller domain-containing protein [Rhodanobacteraceae bacterium]
MTPALLLAAALAVVPSAQSATVPASTELAPPLHPSFRHYGVLDGLPSDAAYTVTQDHSGYIWIGTRDGLARFDAKEFRIFRHDAADPDSLAANDVSALWVDHQGRVWAGGEGNGLNLYRPETGGFAHWQHDPGNSRSLSGDDVMAIAQATDGAIWVGVYAGGLNHLLSDGKSFSHVRHRKGDPGSLLSDNVTALAAGQEGTLWIGTDAGLQWRDRRGHFTRIALMPDETSVAVWQLNAHAGGVDAATDAGLFHVDANGHAQRIGSAIVAYASLRDTSGDLWIAHPNEVEVIAANGVTRRYAPHAGVAGSLPGGLATGMLADNEGGVWFALLDGGVAYLPPRWRAFDAFRHVPDDPDSPAIDRVRALTTAGDGTLLLGGAAGMVDRLDPRDGSVRHLADAAGLHESSITALAEDARGRLWIGHQHGLRVLEGAHRRDIGRGTEVLRHGVWLLLITRGGDVYFAGVGTGVTKVDPVSFALTRMRPPADDDAARQIKQLREAADGTIWAASQAGIARMVPGSGAFHFVPGVARGAVDAFAFGADGTLWLARGDRLQHYALRVGGAHRLDTVNAADGWPAVEVGGLEADRDGRVWAITPRGLIGYDPRSRRVHLYASADGLGNPELAPRTLLKSGRALYTGSLGGVIGIRTAALRADATVPQLAPATLSVRRGGHTLPLDPRKPVALRWNDNELTATAHALSYLDPQRIHYRFLLGGFDPDWVDTGTRDTREFSSLPPGDYTLRIMAAEGDGPWSPASAPIALHIPAPPWDTPWAWAMYALVGLFGVLAFIHAMKRRLDQRHRFAMVAQRQQLAEQANAAKTHFLAGMAHEIRTPMTGVLGMTELLLNTSLDERQRGYADAIRRSGALLMRQLNDALDLARIEAGKLQLADEPFDPAALLREIASIEQGLARQKGLTLQIAIADDAPHALRGDALRVQQVLLNLAHNALKFTQQGGVRLSLAREPGGAVFAVADSGPGLSAHECERVFRRFEQTDGGRRAHGSGLGLTIARELVALMGGHIELHSEVGVGSTFRVHLPLPECEPLAPRQSASAAMHGSTEAVARRMLLVEDDDVAAEVLAGLLRAQGHSVTRAPHALAALAEVDGAREGFDMILLDLDLPGMDGCTLAGMLRARGLQIPMLAVTASSRGDEEQRIRAAGMDALLRKPVLPEALREIFAELDGRAPA